MQLQESPYTPSKSGNSSPLIEGRKEAIGIIMRTLQGVTYPSYSSLRNTAGALGGKNLKTPSTGAQVIKTIIRTNSRCVNLYAE
jgi:hypothetical protein